MMPRLTVLLYHHVGPQRGSLSPWMSTTPEKFSKQLDFLVREGYSVITPQAWVESRSPGSSLPARPVILTFDDGYADFTNHALPELKKRGLQAMVFVVSQLLGKTSNWERGTRSGFPLLSASQIRECAGQGILIGAHSRTHRDLRALTDDQLEDEVRGSREDLENLLGSTVSSFAYPFGYHDPRVVQCVGRHFDVAFTVEEGANDPGSPLHLLRRSTVMRRDLLIDLGLRLRYGWSPVARTRSGVKRLFTGPWRSRDETS